MLLQIKNSGHMQEIKQVSQEVGLELCLRPFFQIVLLHINSFFVHQIDMLDFSGFSSYSTWLWWYRKKTLSLFWLVMCLCLFLFHCQNNAELLKFTCNFSIMNSYCFEHMSSFLVLAVSLITFKSSLLPFSSLVCFSFLTCVSDK